MTAEPARQDHLRQPELSWVKQVLTSEQRHPYQVPPHEKKGCHKGTNNSPSTPAEKAKEESRDGRKQPPPDPWDAFSGLLQIALGVNSPSIGTEN